MDNIDWSKIEHLYCESDIPESHIVKECNVGVSKLRNRAKKEGWVRPCKVSAGRPKNPKPDLEDIPRFNSAEEYLEAVVSGSLEADQVRVSAARCLMAYQKKKVRKTAEESISKKEGQKLEAKAVSEGKFKQSKRPMLVVNNE